LCKTEEELHLKTIKRWTGGGGEWRAMGSHRLSEVEAGKQKKKPSEVCIKTVVSYSCCIRETRKPES